MLNGSLYGCLALSHLNHSLPDCAAVYPFCLLSALFLYCGVSWCLIFLCQLWSWILLLAISWQQIASTFQTSAATKPPSPHFLALFSRNRWNVKWPVYGKKGFYGLTSGRFNRAKCAMSGRSRLNSQWLDGCFGSCVCGRGEVKHI